MAESSVANGTSGNQCGNCSLSPTRVVMSAARQRWKILGDMLRGKKWRGNDSVNSAVSVRRFASFGLLQTRSIEVEDYLEDGCAWYEYQCQGCPEFKVDIRQITGPVQIEDILGFNNTGNVCVWPSEEILTYYCLKRKHLFEGASICELGGGMTCLAGMALAVVSEAKEVLLTDGNEQSCKNLDKIIKRNQTKLASTVIETKVLRWDRNDNYEELEGRYDYVICADCLFFDQWREDLVHTIERILKPQGTVISFAPSRGETFQQFMELAADRFDCEKFYKYDDEVWELHTELEARGKDVYDENLHYPYLLEMRKKATSS